MKSEWATQLLDALAADAAKERPDILCGDGWTIYEPSFFKDRGFPDYVIDRVTTTHVGDGTPKGSIYYNNEVVDELKGVYILDFLYTVASLVGADSSKAGRLMGRGFRARALAEAIKEAIGTP